MDYQVKIMRLSFTGVINIIYMCIYIYTHTHTHTHTMIKDYVAVYSFQ